MEENTKWLLVEGWLLVLPLVLVSCCGWCMVVLGEVVTFFFFSF